MLENTGYWTGSRAGPTHEGSRGMSAREERLWTHRRPISVVHRSSLKRLHFEPSPFDPCFYILPNPLVRKMQDFLARAQICFRISPPVPKSLHHAVAEQTYVCKIPAIKILVERKNQTEASITKQEKQLLRGLIGFLQYACVKTLPDLARKAQAESSSTTNQHRNH